MKQIFISFIVIGKNEGWRLDKCLKSIWLLIDFNKLTNFEIIYVDSDSADNSIEIAQNNLTHKIYEVTGKMNAAVARNAGAKNACGDILFFLDGDIELKPFLFQSFFNENNEFKFNYLVGYLDDINYNSNWIYINQTPRHYKSQPQDKEISSEGGAIIIMARKLWQKYNGMDVRLKVNEDRDLLLRMAKDGLKGVKKADIFGFHHTIPYHDKVRLIANLKSANNRYKGYMLRKHCLNRYYLNTIIHEDWSAFILLISFVLCWFNIAFSIIYFVSAIYKIRKGSNSFSLIVIKLIKRVFQDTSLFFDLFFFYPKKPIFRVKLLNT